LALFIGPCHRKSILGRSQTHRHACTSNSSSRGSTAVVCCPLRALSRVFTAVPAAAAAAAVGVTPVTMAKRMRRRGGLGAGLVVHPHSYAVRVREQTLQGFENTLNPALQPSLVSL
jgi:hypothetical protein